MQLHSEPVVNAFDNIYRIMDPSGTESITFSANLCVAYWYSTNIAQCFYANGCNGCHFKKYSWCENINQLVASSYYYYYDIFIFFICNKHTDWRRNNHWPVDSPRKETGGFPSQRARNAQSFYCHGVIMYGKLEPLSSYFLTVARLFYKRMTSWWRYQMETFSASLALCEGNPP